MHTTSLSLLERLRWPEEQETNWRRFVQLYTPLLYHWARRLGLSAEDAADLVQDVPTRLVAQLPQFTYDPGKRFRGLDISADGKRLYVAAPSATVFEGPRASSRPGCVYVIDT